MSPIRAVGSLTLAALFLSEVALAEEPPAAEPPAAEPIPEAAPPAQEPVAPAEPVYQAPPPQPVYEAPPPAYEQSTVDPSVRHHDGFFLRMSLGVGPGYSTIEVEGFSEVDIRGVGAMFDIMLGGSPTPGLVLGGMLLSHQLSNLEAEYEDGTTSDVDDLKLTTAMLGGFVAYYPDPRSGFNLHALVGYGSASFSNQDDEVSTFSPEGLVVGGGLGYDFWVGDQWSLGPDFRVSYFDLKDSDDDVEAKQSVLVPTLSFTATLH